MLFQYSRKRNRQLYNVASLFVVASWQLTCLQSFIRRSSFIRVILLQVLLAWVLNRFGLLPLRMFCVLVGNR